MIDQIVWSFRDIISLGQNRIRSSPIVPERRKHMQPWISWVVYKVIIRGLPINGVVNEAKLILVLTKGVGSMTFGNEDGMEVRSNVSNSFLSVRQPKPWRYAHRPPSRIVIILFRNIFVPSRQSWHLVVKLRICVASWNENLSSTDVSTSGFLSALWLYLGDQFFLLLRRKGS